MLLRYLSTFFLTLPVGALAQDGVLTSSTATELPQVAPETVSPPAETTGVEGWGDLSTLEAAGGESKIFETRIYGYIDTHFEQVAKTPASVDEMGNTVYESNPYEWDIFNLHAMIQGTAYQRYRYFVNLASPGSGWFDDEPLVLRNAWVEAPLYQSYLLVRAGKTYRRFGLYNEILDAVPTFIGIETPELFDKDHLMLTRTTNFMVHGSVGFDDILLSYSLATGNDERAKMSVPLGGDFHVNIGAMLKLGTSFYWSGGDAVPTRDVGDGSPKGGVLNWMERDRYYVVGGYGQLEHSGFILQAEYWHSRHEAARDLEKTLLLADAGLNERQMNNFFFGGDPANGARRKAHYTVSTFYFRAGYDFGLGDTGSLIPYVQLDYYKNPETIFEKDFGGDAEAGLTDDGEFWKGTAGVVLRPVPPVALKVDGSFHAQKFNGETEVYPEIRLSLSYLWELEL